MKKTDFLAACRTADSRNKALEEIRDKGAEVILATFRMFKNCLVHSLDNAAVTKTVHETHAILTDFAQTVGGYVAITFVEETIFVCGQLLRASRSIYESAREVGKMLSIAGVSEMSFTGDAKEEDLLELCRHFAISVRNPDQRGALLAAKLNRVAVRQVDSTLQASSEEDDLPQMQRALRAYASALVVMRQFFQKVATGKTVLPHRVKRIAQRIVTLAEGSEIAMLSLTSMANAHRDEAGRAVQTAVISVLCARRLTSDRTVLSQLAMSALMADIGRVRVAGKEGLDRYVPLADEVNAAVPPLTSSLFVTTGGVNVQNALRTVVAYEATSMERQHLVGALYRHTMSPLFQSKILYTVRQLMERLAPRDTKRAMSPLDALADLSTAKSIDQTAYKLLVQAIGVLPTGTVVEFETGEWGIVLGPSKTPGAVSKPRIKLVTDRSGQVFANPKVIDLGEPSSGRRFPQISGVIEPDKARFNVTSVLMQEAS
ncbi:MAG: hypothetical protein OXU20_21855 [Myxococcales bacterium]|nr:hypothetical protein [Myxococcales bacterium]MDD9969938.1 hypothetical protein [Myxococcales bacterium]